MGLIKLMCISNVLTAKEFSLANFNGDVLGGYLSHLPLSSWTYLSADVSCMMYDQFWTCDFVDAGPIFLCDPFEI